MTTISEIPLAPGTAQAFSVVLAGRGYVFTLRYREIGGAGWVLGISDTDGNILVDGLPLTTGRNLLEQFAYLDIGGALVVLTDGDLHAAPTFENLGRESHLYFVAP